MLDDLTIDAFGLIAYKTTSNMLSGSMLPVEFIMGLENLWHELSAKTVIELIVAVLAVMIAHPALGLLTRLRESVAQSIALKSKKRAIKRIKRLLDHYAAIFRRRESYKNQPYLATVRTSRENLSFTASGLLIIVILSLFDFLALPATIIFACFVVYILSTISNERYDLENFDDFRDKTQAKIRELQAIVANDPVILKWWRQYFNEDQPAKLTSSVKPQKRSAPPSIETDPLGPQA